MPKEATAGAKDACVHPNEEKLVSKISVHHGTGAVTGIRLMDKHGLCLMENGIFRGYTEHITELREGERILGFKFLLEPN